MLRRLFKREPNLEAIRAGCVYRRVRADNMVETASVLEITDDSFGIPHVRFRVSIGGADRFLFRDGPRLLALRSFAEQYRERIAPEAVR